MHKNQCSFFWGVSASSSTFMKQSYNFLRASRSIAKTAFSLCSFWSPNLAKLLQICCTKGVALEHCQTHVVSLRQSASRALYTHQKLEALALTCWTSKPFLSEQSVFCWSKISLTCGPLKIVILAPSGHPKSIKFEVIFWWKFDRFSDDGDKQCMTINALFSKELMLFQQFCCSVVGGY